LALEHEPLRALQVKHRKDAPPDAKGKGGFVEGEVLGGKGQSEAICSDCFNIHSVLVYVDGFNLFFIGPMREEEKWAGLASECAPVDALESAEVGRTEVEGAAVEQNGTTAFVDFPESAAVVAFLVPREEVAVHIYVSELEDAFVGDDKFLIHVF
jgi:hypothetical protein